MNLEIESDKEETLRVQNERCKKRNFNWKFWKSRRNIVTFMGLWGFFNLYAVRGSFSVAIVAMTKFINVTLENGTVVQEQEFQWDSRQRGMVLGSLFYSYFCTQMIGGILAARFGGNIIFGCGTGISSVLSIFSVYAAKLGIYHLVAVRILVGLFQGFAFPSIQDVYSHWSPEFETTRMTGFVLSGCQIGAFTSFLLSGFLVEYFGWESVFYVFGGFGSLWFVLWMIYIKRDPASDPRISPAERFYIESNQKKSQNSTNIPTPWKNILTSKAVWAQIIPATCDTFGTFTYLTQIPTYLNDVLHYNLGATGFLSAAPYLMYIILTPVASFLSDYLRSSRILSTANVRKLCMITGFLTGAVCLVIMSNSSSMSTIWICLILAVGTTTFSKVSYCINPLDFAPAYAAIVTGVTCTIAVTPAIVAPTVAGFIVVSGAQDEWKTLFYITSGLAVFGTIYFVIFGQGEIQEWAKIDENKSKECAEPLKGNESQL